MESVSVEREVKAEEVYVGVGFDSLLRKRKERQQYRQKLLQNRPLPVTDQELREHKAEVLKIAGNRAYAAYDVVTFGAGCFYIVEALFMRVKGVKAVISGYAGGGAAIKNKNDNQEKPIETKQPDEYDINWPDNYQQDHESLQKGQFGHVEVVQVYFDPLVIQYKKLLEIFWMIHDPQQKDGQGPDKGKQYRSVIFYHTLDQKKQANLSVVEKVEKFPDLTTEVEAIDKFWAAEPEDQDYFRKNPENNYCKENIPQKIKLIEGCDFYQTLEDKFGKDKDTFQDYLDKIKEGEIDPNEGQKRNRSVSKSESEQEQAPPESEQEEVMYDNQLPSESPMPKRQKMTHKLEDLKKLEVIPPCMKPWFFKDKKQPNLLDYDCIGFDVNNCLVKMNLEEVTKILILSHLEALCTKFEGYPKEIMNFNFEENFGVCLNNAIWDIENGAVIKVNEKREVTHAVIGFEPLSQAQIKDLYGILPVFYELNLPDQPRKMENAQGAYLTMFSQMESFKVAIICQIIDMIKFGAIEKSYMQFAFDLESVCHSQLNQIQTDDSLVNLKDHGLYYPQLVEDIQKFVTPEPSVKLQLERLRSNNKKVFLVTNNHIPYLELMMTAAYGDGWLDLFDLVVVNCKQPLFQFANAPLRSVDRSQMNCEGSQKITNGDVLHQSMLESKEKIWIGGNINILTQYFQSICEKEGIKIAFFGDHYVQHFNSIEGYKQQSESEAKWDTIAVLPEICFFEGEARKRQDPNLVPVGGFYWGASNFVYDTKDVENVPSFFGSAIQQYCRYAIPLLEDLPKFIQEKPQEDQIQEQEQIEMEIDNTEVKKEECAETQDQKQEDQAPESQALNDGKVKPPPGLFRPEMLNESVQNSCFNSDRESEPEDRPKRQDKNLKKRKPQAGLRSDSESDSDLSATAVVDSMGLKKDAFNIGTNSTTYESTLKDLLKREKNKRTGRYACVKTDSKKSKLEDGIQLSSQNTFTMKADRTSIEQAIADNKLLVFSKSYCPFASQTKNLLTQLGVLSKGKVVELDKEPNGAQIQKQLKTISGQSTVPNIFINGTHIGGNSELKSANSNGTLNEKLQAAGLLQSASKLKDEKIPRMEIFDNEETNKAIEKVLKDPKFELSDNIEDVKRKFNLSKVPSKKPKFEQEDNFTEPLDTSKFSFFDTETSWKFKKPEGEQLSWSKMRENSQKEQKTEKPSLGGQNPFVDIGSKEKSETIKPNLFDGFGSLETFLKAPEKKTLDQNDGTPFNINKEKWQEKMTEVFGDSKVVQEESKDQKVKEDQKEDSKKIEGQFRNILQELGMTRTTENKGMQQFDPYEQKTKNLGPSKENTDTLKPKDLHADSGLEKQNKVRVLDNGEAKKVGPYSDLKHKRSMSPSFDEYSKLVEQNKPKRQSIKPLKPPKRKSLQVEEDCLGNYRIEQKGLNIIMHPKEEHKFTLIWLHGQGDSAEQTIPLFRDPKLCCLPPECKVVIPNAPTRTMSADGGRKMPCWFNMSRYDLDQPTEIVTEAYCKDLFDQKHIDETIQMCTNLLQEEIDTLGDSTKVFIGGFSQGSCIALSTWLRFNQQLGGVAGIGGVNSSVFDWGKIDLKMKSKTPCFLYHGEEDMFLTVGFARASYGGMKRAGLTHFRFLVEHGLKHNLSHTCMIRLSQFFAAQMDPEFNKKLLLKNKVDLTKQKQYKREMEIKTEEGQIGTQNMIELSEDVRIAMGIYNIEDNPVKELQSYGEKYGRIFKVGSDKFNITICQYGATLLSVKFQDDNSQPAKELTLNRQTPEEFADRSKNPHYGATCGRVAGRIKNAQFQLGEKTFKLTANKAPHHCHGGQNGYSRVMWDSAQILNNVIIKLKVPEEESIQETKIGSGVKFCYTSKNLEEGYPGEILIESTYLVTAENELYMHWSAQLVKGQDASVQTPVNLMNHTYWNLSGDFKESTVTNHSLRLKNSRWYLQTDSNLIPTGSLRSVKNTDLDFTDDFVDLNQVLGKNIAGSSFKGLDHAYTIEGQFDCLAPEKVKLAAELRFKNTQMNVYTTQPSLVVYTSNNLQETQGHHQKQAAVCLETCGFTDAVNHQENKANSTHQYDILAIDNPLIDFTLNVENHDLHKKYGLEPGTAGNASQNQKKLLDFVKGKKLVDYSEDFKGLTAQIDQNKRMTPGGCSLNSLRSAAFELKQSGVTGKVGFMGCVGKDPNAQWLKMHLICEGVTPILHEHDKLETGVCASIVHKKQQTLCCDPGASAEYPLKHLQNNLHIVQASKFVYSSGFFMIQNVPAIEVISKYCAEQNIPFAFNLGGNPCVKPPFLKNIMDTIEHADFVFCNEFEIDLLKEQLKTTDRVSTAQNIARYKKANKKRPRVVVLTQQQQPVQVVISFEGQTRSLEIGVPAIQENEIVDRNGAGDSLAGGFLASLVKGLSIVTAVKEGIQMAACSLRQEGCKFERSEVLNIQQILARKEKIQTQFTDDESKMNQFYQTCLEKTGVLQKSKTNTDEIKWSSSGGILKMGKKYEHTTIHKFHKIPEIHFDD